MINFNLESTVLTQQKTKYDYIDSLRGIAILLVVIVHTSQSIDELHPYLGSICRFGQMGVQLFFVLSALTLSYSLEKVEYSLKTIVAFYIRRVFRIAPVYYLGIVFYFFLFNGMALVQQGMSGINDVYTWDNVCANLFFFHGFYIPANDTIVPGGWSIGTEMAFYLLFPLIFFFIRKMKILGVIFLCSVLVIISILTIPSLASALNLPLENNGFIYFNLLNQLPVFLVGICYFSYLKSSSFPNSKVYNISLIPLLFVALFSAFYLFDSHFHVSYVPVLTSISFLVLIEIFRINPILNLSLLKRIGQLSYSIYLFHFLFSWTISIKLNNLLSGTMNGNLILLFCLLISILGSITIAHFSEKIIEKPMINLGGKVIQRLNN